MISELHISNLAVIEDTTLEFESDYVSLIGETGAGKSLIVNSLSLLKGQKADFSLIRNPKEKAIVSALFRVNENLLKLHPELNEYIEEGSLVVKRMLLPDKTNRYYLNGSPVGANEFKEMMAHLIDIHSQGENWDLFKEQNHLSYLDRYGKEKIEKAYHDFSLAYEALKEDEKQKKELLEAHKELDRDYLLFQIAEIEKYDVKENEIEDLNQEYESLKSYAKIASLYKDYQELSSLSEGRIEDILSKITVRLHLFENTSLSEESKALIASFYQANDAIAAFKEAFDSLDSDPRRIDEINERLFSLKGLQRKYGKTTKEILDKYNDYKEKLTSIDAFEDKAYDIDKKIEEDKRNALEKAKILSSLRHSYKEKMEKGIGKEMADLGLPKDGFLVNIKEKELSIDGIDEVSFLIRLNAGLDYAPLKKAASGGESARLMLSLKVVLNALDPYDMLVFDEIDSGVSGRIASLMAKKIKTVSKTSQVMVISHLPQVVASSFSSISIQKKTKDNQTFTVAKTLNEDEFTLEVAKMLSGTSLKESAIVQAKELIKENREAE